jgi:hypothetical protein
MAIPNKLIISSLMVEKDKDFIPIIKSAPELFDEAERDDADFNKLTLFLMREKLKGDKSFYYPMF